MRRFLIAPGVVTGTLATLPDHESHHIAAVLRLTPGTRVELFDGSGTVYQGELETVDRRRVTVSILSRRHEPVASRPIILCQSLLKGGKMDFLVQKAVELGVHTFQPVLTRYCEAPAPTRRQVERWQRIMLEACKQSGRATAMHIEEPAAPGDINLGACATRILFWEGERTGALKQDSLGPDGPVCLAVGPEGGFHDDDIRAYRAADFRTVSLGGLTLRAETATLAGIAVVRYLTGGLHPPSAS